MARVDGVTSVLKGMLIARSLSSTIVLMFPWGLAGASDPFTDHLWLLSRRMSLSSLMGAMPCPLSDHKGHIPTSFGP